jgi:hypothetical protein
VSDRFNIDRNLYQINAPFKQIETLTEQYRKMTSDISIAIDKINLYSKEMKKGIESFQKMTESVKDSPIFKKLSSAHNSSSFPHEIYEKIFPSSEFTKEDIKSHENVILQALKDRVPLYFDDMSIKNTFEQAIKLHADGYYLFVCRTIYPEIENVIFTEILEKDPNWLNNLSENLRTDFKRNKHFKTLLRGKPKESSVQYPLLYDKNLTIRENGFYKSHFILALCRTFNNFDVLNLPQENLTAARNLYCHGVKDKADFMDSLNSLLLLDMTLQLLKEYKDSIENQSNSTPLEVSTQK